MTVPRYPSHFFKRPFASEGTYRIVSDEKPASGRASLKEGFPEETQNPLGYGGVAPNRMDFNGILNMMTSMLCWMQSGGLWQYDPSQGYTVPSVVFHEGGLWWCEKANGPETEMGIVEPGTDDSFWTEFLHALGNMGGASAFGNPVGTVITFYGTSPPEGYFECNGAAFSATQYPELYSVIGKSILPDYRGRFLRGYDPGNSAYLIGHTFSGDVSDFARIDDGALTASFGGKEIALTGLDFTEAVNSADVCGVLETAINTAIGELLYEVTVTDGKFVIAALKRGASYTIGYARETGTGTDIGMLLGLTEALGGTLVVGADPVADSDGHLRSIGDIQEDAIRNIYSASGPDVTWAASGVQPPFFRGKAYSGFKGGSYNFNVVGFDASLSVPTAGDNRPRNACLLICIKHD